MKYCFFCFLSAFGVLGLLGQDASSSVSGTNCTFQAAPDKFLAAEARARLAVHQRAQQFQKSAAVAGKSAAADRSIAGRNQFYQSIYWSVAGWTSLRAMTWDIVTMTGNNYDLATGASNFIIGGSIT